MSVSMIPPAAAPAFLVDAGGVGLRYTRSLVTRHSDVISAFIWAISVPS
jgi:hypothetical protein